MHRDIVLIVGVALLALATTVPITESIAPVVHPAFPTQPALQAPAQAAAAATPAMVPDDNPLPAQDIAPEPTADPSQVVRIQNPYTTPPLAGETVNTRLRAAIVNILCFAPTNAGLAPISGSGVIISESGLVLTNAHVAQYVLLADASPIPITCTARTGSPARAVWEPHIAFISSQWVEKHAADIRESAPTGTGEYDIALLALTPLADAPATFPFITPDVREAVTFLGDPVIVGSYPAGFAGNITIGNSLSLTTSPTTIQELFTFSENTVDLLSLGGIIVAQSGSSGGGVANMWGYLVGMVSTSSEGESTGARDLRAITMAHANRTLIEETGTGLLNFASRNPEAARVAYKEKAAELAAQIVAEIQR